jgi:serine/threonine-protein kinase
MDNAGKMTPLRPAPDPSATGLDLTGRTLDDFHVLRRLGQGGMGEVYLAEQVSLKRKVALKILRTELAVNPAALERFKQEAENVARATHANIVQVYSIGTADGVPYMALEYVEGRNLREFLTKKGPPELSVALRIMCQVAAALQRAAELGVVHRDIKPDNILLTRKGEVKVTDFGLSRVLVCDQQPVHLTATGVTMGTPLYMSPEQVEGKPIDARTDIYSFGITCYHMLAGHPPFQGESAFEVALQHVRGTPKPLHEVRPDLPPSLCAVVHKMMAKDPDQRYQSGRELLKELTSLRTILTGTQTGPVPPLTVDSVPATPPSGASRTVVDPLQGRSRWVFALVGLTIGLGLAVGGALGWYASRPEPLPPALPNGSQADAGNVDAVLHSPLRREQALRQAAEQYLDPATASKNIATGYGLCADLLVFYLENDRLDDAEKWSFRLESFKVPQYHHLGLVGRALVLALRNQVKDSNEMFSQLARELNGPRVQSPLKRLDEPRHAALRYWITRALYYNGKNGLPESEVPSFFKPLRELAVRY